jgi:hypothetical protein
MRRRFFTVTVVLVVALSGGVFATRGDGVSSARQWAVVYLAEPTLIGSTIVQGPVIFTHDDERMARGEPCTTVQLLEPAKGPLEEIASFHCIPRSAPAPHRFTIKTRPNTKMGYGCVLTEYQFAGDGEAHGVRISADAH